MAKALLGHVGFAADARLIEEVCRLRRRVRELEAEAEHLRAVNSALVTQLRVDEDVLSLSVDDELALSSR